MSRGSRRAPRLEKRVRQAPRRPRLPRQGHRGCRSAAHGPQPIVMPPVQAIVVAGLAVDLIVELVAACQPRTKVDGRSSRQIRAAQSTRRPGRSNRMPPRPQLSPEVAAARASQRASISAPMSATPRRATYSRRGVIEYTSVQPMPRFSSETHEKGSMRARQRTAVVGNGRTSHRTH